MIRVISGAIGTELKNSRSKPFSLPPEQEKRLVERGVAAYVSQDAAGAGPSPIPEYDVKTNANRLKDLLKAIGLTAAVGMTKQEMVNALDAHYLPDSGDTGGGDDESDDEGDDDGEEPPDLGGDGIVR